LHASLQKLKGKGKLEVGGDADILLLDKNTLKLKSVIAKGRVVMTPKWTHGGMFTVDKPAPSQRVPSSAEKMANTRKWLASGCEDPNCC
jgi:adenine deaminase